MNAIPHGVWLFHDRNIFDDRRIWLEQDDGAWDQTPFNRAIGLKRNGLGHLDYRGTLSELKGSAPSLPRVLGNLYGRQFMTMRPITATSLDHARAIAVLAAPHLWLRSVRGIAKLVAIASIRVDDKP